MNEIAINIEKLNYSYPSDWSWRRTPCLHDVTFSVRTGETFGFLGHNGAGKTTAIKCMLGLIKPSSGNITICGKDYRSPEARAKIGYLPEQPYFYDHLTVEEILSFYGTLSGVAKGEFQKAVDRALELVKMSDRRKQRMRELSKGLTQRVAMAQSIVGYPEVLILDEPFSGLDPLGRKEFTDLLCHLREAGATIIICSHILKDVEVLCDRVSIMIRGHIKGVYNIDNLPATGQAQYILMVKNTPDAQNILYPLTETRSANEAFLRLTFHDEKSATAALSTAVKNDVAVESYHQVLPGLEEVFVHMVEESRSERGEA